MGHESELLKSYFKTIELLEGGADTGFRHVKPTEYTPRLLHFHGDRKHVEIKERPLNKHSLDSSDVFILDLGLTIYQWNGKTCNKDEKFKAVQYLQTLKAERSGKPKIESLDEREISDSHEFYTKLSNDPLEEGEQDESDVNTFVPSMFRVSDESGSLEMSLIQESQKLDKGNLDSKDVFIVDTGKGCFVWIGSGASENEKKNGLTYAHNYMMKSMHPFVPVTCLKEGQETGQFNAIWA